MDNLYETHVFNMPGTGKHTKFSIVTSYLDILSIFNINSIRIFEELTKGNGKVEISNLLTLEQEGMTNITFKIKSTQKDNNLEEQTDIEFNKLIKNIELYSPSHGFKKEVVKTNKEFPIFN